MKILVAYYSQTNNTRLIAETIYKHLSKEYQVSLKKIKEISPLVMNEYDLVFIGSACHHSTFAKPVLDLLDKLPKDPPYAMAGFYCHSTYKSNDPYPRAAEMFDKWAAKGIETFNEVSLEKGIDFKGVFNCMGAPSLEISRFINSTIIVNEEEWEIYLNEIVKHPSPKDIEDAKMFAEKAVS
jgi:flavodoxin